MYNKKTIVVLIFVFLPVASLEETFRLSSLNSSIAIAFIYLSMFEIQYWMPAPPGVLKDTYLRQVFLHSLHWHNLLPSCLDGYTIRPHIFNGAFSMLVYYCTALYVASTAVNPFSHFSKTHLLYFCSTPNLISIISNCVKKVYQRYVSLVVELETKKRWK